MQAPITMELKQELPLRTMRIGLSAKILIPVLTVSVVVFLVFFHWSGRKLIEQGIEDLRSRLLTFSSTQAAELREPIWSFDSETIDRLFRSYALANDFLRATLFDAEGNVLASTRGTVPTEPFEVFNSWQEITRDWGGETYHLGWLQVVYHDGNIRQTAKARRVGDFLAVSLLILVFATVTVLTVHLCIGLPLRRLTESLSRNAAQGLREPLTWSRRDEIGDVVASYNLLLTEVDRQTRNLKKINTELELENSQRKWAEEKYRSIFNNATEGIFQIGGEGRFLAANPASARILGYEAPEEMLGIGDVAAQLSIDPHRKNELLRLLQEHGTVQEFEIGITRKDARLAWISLNMRAARNESGRFLYYEGSAQDITDRKALESRLLQAQKMEAIGTLAGGIAHDFNNILAAIMGFTELAKNRVREDDVGRYLDQVLKSSVRAKDLVAQILTFSRKAEWRATSIDMAEVVEEAMKLIRATFPSTIDIRTRIASETCTVMADSAQIHQLVINLCTNAAHAMKERQGILEVDLDRVNVPPHTGSLHHDPAPGTYVKLTVGDTGTGIFPSIVDRIFDPFFTTKEVGQGSGLGLSVVYGIVKERGGTVTVDSVPEEGSVFTVYLPATTEKTSPQATPVCVLPRGNEQILFVDDERILVDMARNTLEDLGYRVAATESSASALEMFTTSPNRFDLIITDMTMPHMTGIDLAKEVLKIQPSIPVILCTGYSELVTEQEAKSLGIREFLMKPVTMTDLSMAVRKVLEDSPA